MGLPNSCQQIVNKIKALQAQIKQIQLSAGYTQGPDDPHPGKPDPESLAEVKALQAQIAKLKLSLNSCILNNVAPFPLKIKVSSIYCVKEQETGILQDDEPYVLVASIDLNVFPIPNLEVTLYGPFEDVNTGESRTTNGTPFWALDKSAKTIAQPTDVIFLVAMMENDDGTPNATRGLVKAQLTAALAASIGMPRPQLINVLINDMSSALAIPTGFPSSDDRIGVKELVLTPLDLVLPILGPRTRTLSFSGDGAKYDVSCLLTQG
ncbi:MAG: Uncharacterized protein FD167_1392 [bacterium]|nr:MAG: Uncharacterized protein FD167_1392 [bacterium]